MVEAPEPIEHGLWVLSGFAGERTGDRAPEQGFSKVKVFNGLHLEGKLAIERNEGNFDYLFFEALYNKLYEGPDSYGGFSGGPLWQSYREAGWEQISDRGHIAIRRSLLSVRKKGRWKWPSHKAHKVPRKEKSV